jgi:hypothetical protein
LLDVHLALCGGSIGLLVLAVVGEVLHGLHSFVGANGEVDIGGHEEDGGEDIDNSH